MSKEEIITKESQNEAFWKGLKVVKSCQNLFHINAAKRYVRHFAEIYCKVKPSYLLASSTTAQQMEVLRVAIEEQIKKLD